MVNYFDSWARMASEIPVNIEKKEAKNIIKGSKIIAESISKGHVAFLFGSGHSSIPVEEMYPRYGGILGFIPILELPLSFFTQVIGNLGFSQFDYLENNAEYGQKILDNYIIHKEDTLIVFSHSGSTPVTTQIASSFKAQGGRVIGIISRHRTETSRSKHPSGKTIIDFSDVVIDTLVPDSDVSVKIGNSHLGPLSTIGSVAVANLLSIGVFLELRRMKIEPLINPVRAFDVESDRKMMEILTRYREIYAAHISVARQK